MFTFIVALFFSMGHLAGAYQKEGELLKAKRIEAESFELRGPDGRLRASLFMGPDDEANLSFFDPGGRPRLIFGLDKKGSPIISFFNDKQNMRMSFSLDSNDGTPHITLLDDDGEPDISLGMVKGFGPDLTIGKRGQGRISISVSPEGSPSIQFVDQKNNPRISLSVAGNSPTISLLGDDQVVRTSLRLLPDGSPSFSLSDSHSRERLLVMIDKDGKPSIRFLDPDKKAYSELK